MFRRNEKHRQITLFGTVQQLPVGVACGKGRAALFRRGEVVRTIEEADFLEALMAEVERV